MNSESLTEDLLIRSRFQLPPFVIAKTVNGTDVFDGFMPAIIQRVFRSMNMNLVFKREPTDKYGTFENNTWTGMAGMLYKGEVDILMNPLIPKPAFYDFAVISNPVTIEAFTILSGKEVEEAGLFLYFSVLDKWVWAGMAITLLVVAFTSVFLFKEAMMTSALKKMQLFNEYCWLFFAYMMRE
ncbi:uncharacterized protein LOC118199171, partial [Stegodyphus dumicola]|uniref:uncharacterized protein LOC118199171 n=1 Tax=Stegodyphus dumicola TaxID=202533 RepID=UPI0015B2961B